MPNAVKVTREVEGFSTSLKRPEALAFLDDVAVRIDNVTWESA